MKQQFVILLASTIALSGCANAFGVKSKPLASAQDIKVVTMPAGALVETEYGNSCTTPCKVPLLTSRGGELTISLDGHQTERAFITSSVFEKRLAIRAADVAVEAIEPDPASIALNALGQLIGGKGAVMELDQRRLDLELLPLLEGEADALAPAMALTGNRISHRYF